MSAYFTKLYADSETALEEKINKTIKDLGYMRQPGVTQRGPIDPDNEQGQWYAVIKYWGLD